MGTAIVLGAVRAGVVPAANFLIAEPEAEKRAFLSGHSLTCVSDAWHGMDWAQGHHAVVLLAVKPQILPQLAADCVDYFAGSRFTIISILAGTPIAKLISLLGPDHHFIRAMPNLPASIGLGTTAISIAGSLPHSDDAFAKTLFSAIGHTVIPLPESLFDAFTAVAGSGPAYLFYLAESMQLAAVSQGFDPAIAAIITRSTLLGAATMLSQSSEDATTLRHRVTSKGGTTEAAIKTFDSLSVSQSIEKGIAAATARGQELSR